MVRPFYPCNWGKMGASRGKTGYWPFLHEDSVSERVNYHVTFVFIIGQISHRRFVSQICRRREEDIWTEITYSTGVQTHRQHLLSRMRDFVDPPHTRATRSAGDEFGEEYKNLK